MKNISILGSTGSIGTQALEVIKYDKEYNVVALSTNKNIDLLERQALEFNPKIVSVGHKEKGLELKKRLKKHNIEVVVGIEGLKAVAKEPSSEIVLTSVVGMVGLLPTLEAIKAGKTIALANKETLVTAGRLVTDEAKKNNVKIIPVDSEHSAIFQCLQNGSKKEVSKLILTASGGPFRGKTLNELKKVRLEDALNHPNWSMGKKITVDSATLMNKGLEVIEARWLFDIIYDKIDVIVHPQSIIHSMVEYIDGSIISQMGIPDMKGPIHYALTYPMRKKNNFGKLNLVNIGELTFHEPDTETFPCLNLAINAGKMGGTMPAVLNGANEIVVDLFLNGKIEFINIPELIEKVMGKHTNILQPTLSDIKEADRWARESVYSELK